MTNISRRSVAKGAAWTVPAVAVAAGAPAFAASGSGPTSIQACPQGTTFTNTGAGSISAMVSGDGTYAGGTYVSIDTGQIQIPAAVGNDGSSVTGFHIFYRGGVTGATTGCDCNQDNGGVGPEFTMKTKNGTTHKGKVTYSGTTGCSPQVAGAGFDGNLGIQTDVPYSGISFPNDSVCNVGDSAHIVSMDIPFTVSYLNGLTPIGCCHYVRHVTYNPSGCMPFGQQSMSTTYVSGA